MWCVGELNEDYIEKMEDVLFKDLVASLISPLFMGSYLHLQE
jgi:hypothetical protein